MTGSPVVELNRAVAVAMADGPAAGLALLQRLEAGGALAGTGPERRFLNARLALVRPRRPR
jgi:predicted RNA polymerase sigma factor